MNNKERERGAMLMNLINIGTSDFDERSGDSKVFRLSKNGVILPPEFDVNPDPDPALTSVTVLVQKNHFYKPWFRRLLAGATRVIVEFSGYWASIQVMHSNGYTCSQILKVRCKDPYAFVYKVVNMYAKKGNATWVFFFKDAIFLVDYKQKTVYAHRHNSDTLDQLDILAFGTKSALSTVNDTALRQLSCN
jgi:hypothetical protein